MKEQDIFEKHPLPWRIGKQCETEAHILDKNDALVCKLRGDFLKPLLQSLLDYFNEQGNSGLPTDSTSSTQKK